MIFNVFILKLSKTNLIETMLDFRDFNYSSTVILRNFECKRFVWWTHIWKNTEGLNWWLSEYFSSIVSNKEHDISRLFERITSVITLLFFRYRSHSLSFMCTDLLYPCARKCTGTFVCGGKHQSVARVWQHGLLTLPTDDGKEPRFQSKHQHRPLLRLIKCQGRTHTDRAERNQSSHQECVFALFVLMWTN